MIGADDGGQNRHGVMKVDADAAISQVHHDVGSRLQLGHIWQSEIDVPTSRAASGEDFDWKSFVREQITDGGGCLKRSLRSMFSHSRIGAVRSADRIGLQAAQAKVCASANRACNLQRLSRRTRAGAVIANVEIDQKINGARCGGLIPFDLPHVVHNSHRAGRGDARDFRRIGKRRRQQDAGDSVRGHQLGFSDGRDRDSASSMRDLTLRDFHALVRFRVRAKLLAGFFHRLRQAREVGFEKIGIEQQRGGRNLIFCEHRFEL